MRIGKPGMEGHYGYFDGKCDKQHDKCQQPGRNSEKVLVCHRGKNRTIRIISGVHHVQHVECMRARFGVGYRKIKSNDYEQHKYRPEKCVKEEFDGSIFAPRATPYR